MSHKSTHNAACSYLLALALVGHLAGCASTAPQAGDEGQAAPAASTALPAAAWPAASEVAQAAAVPASGGSGQAGNDSPDSDKHPLIIRGNDRMLASAKGGGVIKGPVSNFKFEDAPVGEVVHVMLRDLLKVDYVVHPPLKGSVTLVTRGNVSADKAMLLLESALQLNGIVMARDSRGTYHVGTPESLRGIVAAPRQAGGGTLPPGYGAVVIPLQYLGAAEMAGILQPMVSPDAIVRVDTLRNILIMRGTRAEAEGWLDLVNTFDVNLLRGMSVGVFPLKHTSAAEVEAALRLLSG
ncbi:MAG: type II secretion system protein GspD, partial [Comamonadaceae bacterium]|nr:type II secretion system protein GspD [Comamonadaceae bacterium]